MAGESGDPRWSVRGGSGFVVNNDDIDMRKKIKKKGKDARARAEGYQISP